MWCQRPGVTQRKIVRPGRLHQHASAQPQLSRGPPTRSASAARVPTASRRTPAAPPKRIRRIPASVAHKVRTPMPPQLGATAGNCEPVLPESDSLGQVSRGQAITGSRQYCYPAAPSRAGSAGIARHRIAAARRIGSSVVSGNLDCAEPGGRLGRLVTGPRAEQTDDNLHPARRGVRPGREPVGQHDRDRWPWPQRCQGDDACSARRARCCRPA